MTRTVLAIDQGTSGTKAIVVCPERGVLATATVDLHPRYGNDGAVEIDPELLLSSVVEAGRRALDLAGEPVAAVGLANQGETVLAWDRATGTPLTPAIVWQDRRSAALCAQLAPAGGRLAELTGLPLDPYFAAPKLAWLRRMLTRDGVAATSDSWLVQRLTGAFVTDATTASRTMLLDLDRVEWSAEALGVFGLQDEALPAVVDCAGPVGMTRAFGDASLPLTGLVVDQQAALLAQGCLAAGDAKCTYGTGAFLLANAGGPVRSSAGLSTSVAWRLAGAPAYCADGQVFTVASAVRWLTELGIITGPQDLDAVGGSVPDSAGVTFLPALAGLGAPHWRPDATGTLTGLTLGTTPAHVVRALLDGIAAQVTDLALAVEADLGRRLGPLRVDGGLTRSRLLMQTQADLLQLPVQVNATADATALGAAALAWLGLDPSLTVAGVLAFPGLAPAAPAEQFEPQLAPDQAAERMHRHRALLTST